jgi:hypothetical protein
MHKPVIAAVVAVLITICLVRPESAAQSPSVQPPMQWQYRILIDRQTRLIEPQLKQLGEQGWELVSVSESPDSPDGSQLFVFKRPAR